MNEQMHGCGEKKEDFFLTVEIKLISVDRMRTHEAKTPTIL
jgi:hypothetical protein